MDAGRTAVTQGVIGTIVLLDVLCSVDATAGDLRGRTAERRRLDRRRLELVRLERCRLERRRLELVRLEWLLGLDRTCATLLVPVERCVCMLLFD